MLSPVFEYGRPPRSMPILAFAGALLLASCAALWLIALIRRTREAEQHKMLMLVFAAGCAVRLVLLGATPVLEVDYNRYLWDGGVTASGYNPYAIAPAAVARLPYDDPRLEMSKAAGEVFDGISYPSLKTIYPPVAQVFFSLAHGLAKWSLTAWRIVAIGMEIVTFGLIVTILLTVGRSPLWSALYWWHPLVLKETIDSAHMEVILTPFVLGAVLATMRQRHILAVTLLTLAIGVKLWPVLLLPLILRPLLSRPVVLLGACSIVAAACVAYAVPIVRGGLDPSSGFVSFATHWATNSAHFLALETAVRLITGSTAPADLAAGRLVRGLMALLAAGFAVRLAWSQPADADDTLTRAYWTVTVLLLASPTQFPWYALWVLPLAVTQPHLRGWLIAAAVLPLYYSAFHFNVRGQSTVYAHGVVWLIWVPVWLAMIRDVRLARPRSRLPLTALAKHVSREHRD